jgi:cell division protein FtsW (lipid II flippase)
LGHGEDPLDIKKCQLDLTSLQAREESAIRWVFFFFFLQFVSQPHLGNFVNLFIVCFWVILLSGKMMYLMRLIVVASQPHLGNFVYLLIVCVFVANFVEW